MPTPRRTQAERVADSRRRLLEAAVELFAAQGYGATSAGSIAERAGLVRSMLNTRFGDKEGLLTTLLEDHWVDELVRAMDNESTGLDAVLAAVTRFEHFAREEPQRLRAFLVISFEAAGPTSVPLEHVVAPLARLSSSLADAVQRGLVDGTIKQGSEYPVERIVDIGLGLAYRWVLAPDNQFAERLRAWRDELEAALSSGVRHRS
jgi:AcrR family transcriptional regulator